MSLGVIGGVLLLLLLLLLLLRVVPLLVLLVLLVTAAVAVGCSRGLLALANVMLQWRSAGVTRSSKLVVIRSSHCGG